MKRNYWPHFFIILFVYVMSKIVWTIYSAMQSPVYKDESFLNTYHNVDENYNNIAFSNENFLKNYDFELKLNDEIFGLTFEDIKYSQRVLEKKSTHKNILNTKNNTLVITIVDKKSKKPVDNAKIELRIMTPTYNKNDYDFNDFNYSNGSYNKEFSLPHIGNFNLTGKVIIENQTGYIFIKTNAI